MVSRKMMRWVGALAFAWLAAASTAAAAEVPKIAVLPFVEGEKAPERSGARFTGLLTDELKTRDDEVHFIAASPPKAGPGAPAKGAKVDARAAFADGKRALSDLSFDEALASFKKGIEASLADPASADLPAVLEAHISIAVAYFRQGEEKAAQGALFTVARLAPDFKLPEGKFPPVFTRELEKAKKRVQKASKASLSIEGPPGATAFVDGRDLGMVPVLEEDLPHGQHFVRVEGTKGERFGKVVELKENLTRIKAVFLAGAPSQSLPPGAEPKVAAVLDNALADQVSGYARGLGVDYVLVGLVYRSGDHQLTAATALYSARRQGFAPLKPLPVDDEMLTAPVEAFKLADEVAKTVEAFGTPAALPLKLGPEAGGTRVAVAPRAMEVELPSGPRLALRPKPEPGAETEPGVRALARPSTFEGEATRFDAPPQAEPVPGLEPIKTGTPAWLWVVVGVGVAAAAGGAYYGVSEATRPVTGSLTATW